MKTLTIFLLAVLTALPLSLPARTVREFFADEPGQIFAIINRSARLDMCDYFDAGQKVSVENLFGNGTRLDTITDLYMRLHTSETHIVEIRLMPFKSDTIIAVIETALTPAPDSHITFYNRHWYRLREIKPFKAPTINDFFLSSTPKDTRRELIAGLQFPMIEYTFTGPGFATLEARHSLRAFLGKEVFKSYAPYMRPTLTYRIDGAKIKPLKP